MNNSNIFTILCSILMSALGATTKNISTLDKKKFDRRKYVVAVFVAASIGLAVSLVCLEYKISPFLSMAIMYFIGWKGKGIVNILIKKAEEKL